jgi:putative hydroxymethylpyrimidine transport system substrate-binding protein
MALRRLTTLAALLVATAVAIPGCAEKSEGGGGGSHKREKFNIILDYFPNADHAGIYAAQAAGDYDRAGLDVDIKPPPDPSAPLKLLRTGQADVVISYEPELLLARDKGSDLVSVAALVQKPLTTLMTLDGSIHSPADLAGKRVGTAGIPYQTAYLQTILRNAGVDPATVKETHVGFNLVPAMLSRKVDATLGAFWNYEGVDLKRRGRNPTILRMEKLGVPTYNELIVVARRKDLDENFSNKLRRFLRATAEGHKRLRSHPEIGVDALLRVDPGLERGLQTDVVSETLPVFFPTDTTKPFGWQDPNAWKAYGDWMYEQKLLKRPPEAEEALTNEFLPGEGLSPRVSATP